MIPLPPADPALPGLPVALDGVAMAERLTAALPDCRTGRLRVASCRPRYVRYKPGTNCLVHYAITFEDGESMSPLTANAYARVYGGGRGARRWRKPELHALARRAGADPDAPFRGLIAYLPDAEAVVQLYPVDRRLSGLAELASPRRATRILRSAMGAEALVDTVRLVRYRPERKALMHVLLRNAQHSAVYVKLYADGRQHNVLGAARALRASGMPTPEPIAVLDSPAAYIQAEVPGRSLADLRGTQAYEPLLADVAGLLGRLHRLPIDTAAPSVDEAELILGAGRTVGQIVPSIAGRAERLARRLTERMAEIAHREALIHGDFYDDQLLVSPEGLVLLDLDEVRRGEPLVDVGNMLAQLDARMDGLPLEEARARFATAAEALDPRVGSHARLFEAAGLLKLALGPFRRLEPDWPTEVARLVELAELRATAERGASVRVDSDPPGADQHGADPALPQVPLLLNRRAVEPLFADVLGAPLRIVGLELMRHKRGRRCLLRYDLRLGRDVTAEHRVVFVKAFASERAERVFAGLEALRAAENTSGPRLPEPLAYLAPLRAVVMGELVGDPIEPALTSGDVALAGRVAEALHALHQSGARLPRQHLLADELEPLAERTEMLSAALPGLAASARRCLSLARGSAARPWRWRSLPVHRDCYPDQVLDGPRIGLVDLDDAAMSEPAVDVANFLAHLRLSALRAPQQAAAIARSRAAFADAYQQRDPDLDAGLVTLLEGATLLRLADIHRPRPRGERLAARLLEESRWLLELTA